jgi:hypothetical protein
VTDSSVLPGDLQALQGANVLLCEHPAHSTVLHPNTVWLGKRTSSCYAHSQCTHLGKAQP